MIGSDLESQPKPPLVAAVLLAMALGCELVGLMLSSRGWLMCGLLPLAVAIVWWLTRERPFAAKLTENGIVLTATKYLVPYDEIRAVWPAFPGERLRSKGESFALRIQHGGEVLNVPARLNVSSQELFDFLATKIHVVQATPANPAVAEYMQRQVAMFGTDHVWSFCAQIRSDAASERIQYRKCLVMLSAVPVGAVWCGTGLAWRMEEWTVFGGITMVVGLFGSLLFFVAAKSSTPRVKNWRGASLVISPLGFALAQGDLCGELRWKEVRDVRLRHGSGALFSDVSARGSGVVVRVDGAEFLVADFYDAPIQVIYDRISQLWRHGE
jgi:hypothetical protein